MPGADASAFFQAHVPEALRTAALRKLWTTDPTISGFIEMADYQWDFNNPDAIPGWGSRLDTPDVRRLAERILGGADDERPARAEGEAVQEAEAAQQDSVTGEAPDQTAPDEHPTEPTPLVASAASPMTDDVAMQKTPSDSVLYTSPKKRHGGALPS